MMRILITALLVAAAAPALAVEPGYEQFAVRVQTADLDLASAQGQRMLGKRLDLAVNRLCGTPVFFSRDELSALDACRADAMQAAAPQINAARSRQAVTVASNR
jgi:UrcA family protein